MTESSRRFMTMAAIAGALIAGVLALVMLLGDQPLVGAGLAVIAIASLGTLPLARRGNRAGS
ncbi:MAG: hypothetical protein ACTMII_00955 [Brachybacterium sp.]|uniref:hypothetical protein n=1 Tax=Brachybacterium TaxID=43668 RepID=UPI0031ECE04B